MANNRCCVMVTMLLMLSGWKVSMQFLSPRRARVLCHHDLVVVSRTDDESGDRCSPKRKLLSLALSSKRLRSDTFFSHFFRWITTNSIALPFLEENNVKQTTAVLNIHPLGKSYVIKVAATQRQGKSLFPELARWRVLHLEGYSRWPSVCRLQRVVVVRGESSMTRTSKQLSSNKNYNNNPPKTTFAAWMRKKIMLVNCI